MCINTENQFHNIVDIKRGNIKNIINYLRETPFATKKEIADALSLSFATVSNLCNFMESQGYLVSQSDTSYGKVGRSPKNICLRPDSCLLAAVDIHRSNKVVMRLYDLFGNMESHAEFSYKGNDIHALIEEIFQEYCLAFTEEQRKRVDGMGVAVSGIYDTETGLIVCSELDLFEGQPLKQMLTDMFSISVYIENESNLCAFGIAQKMKTDNLIYIYIGEGLGIGIISDGEIIRGQRGYASEICHVPLGLLDRKCPLCGNDHCMQTDLSTYGFAEKFTGVTPVSGDHRGWERFIKAYVNGDEHALSVVRENAYILAVSISIVVNLLDPATVTIGGISDSLFQGMNDTVKTVVSKRRGIKNAPDITFSHDDNFTETLLRGTLEMVYSKWFPNIYGVEYTIGNFLNERKFK